MRPVSASTYQPTQRSYENLNNAAAASIMSSPYMARNFQQNRNSATVKSVIGPQRPISAYTNLSTSTKSRSRRPGSAHVVKARLSHLIGKKGRGIGYFGDENDAMKEIEKKN